MILDQIVEATKKRLLDEKQRVPYEVMIQKVYEALIKENKKQVPFETILSKEGIQFICEVKKASPSKGIIAREFPYVEIAKEYEMAGASAISVLTEPFFFQGRSQYLKEIYDEVTIPLLRKDFILEEYQIYEAKILGASCVLLIVAILKKQTLKQFILRCQELNISALVEIHNEKEMEDAIWAGASIIGINNRNLKNFQVTMDTSIALREKIPQSILVVAESGITTAEQVQELRTHNIHGVLIGETMMRAENKKEMLELLRGRRREES